jgi:hypothetical protein
LDVLVVKEAWQRNLLTPLSFELEEREKLHHQNDASARPSVREKAEPRVQANAVADNANAEILKRRENEARKEETERPHASQRKQEKREGAASKHQKPSKDQQLKPCEDGQCERQQDASTIANKKEQHQ